MTNDIDFEIDDLPADPASLAAPTAEPQMVGAYLMGPFEKLDRFEWTDQSTGKIKLLRSVKMRLANGDGTIDRVSISIPEEMDAPRLEPEQVYAFPVFASVNKKKLIVTYTLIPRCPPFPAPVAR